MSSFLRRHLEPLPSFRGITTQWSLYFAERHVAHAACRSWRLFHFASNQIMLLLLLVRNGRFLPCRRRPESRIANASKVFSTVKGQVEPSASPQLHPAYDGGLFLADNEARLLLREHWLRLEISEISPPWQILLP